MSEIIGRVPLCDLDKLSLESFGGRGVQLVIVGHTPTTIGVPLFLNCAHRYTGDLKWLLQLDTQYTNRVTNHSCTAFNMNGHFISYYTFEYNNEKVTAMIHSEDIGRPMPKNMGEPGRTYSYNGIIIENDHGNHIGKCVYVSCVPGPLGINKPSIEVVQPTAYVRSPPLPIQYAYYTWGDVEGSTAFLEGCQTLRKQMTKYLNDDAKYVSIGDVLGQTNIYDEPTGIISDKETVEFANTAAIKIIGNRDWNKLRIAAEFLHAEAKQKWPTKKNDLKTSTYAFKFIEGVSDERLDNKWVPDTNVQWSHVVGTSIVDSYQGKTLPPPDWDSGGGDFGVNEDN